jgi:hypothetical protein
MDSSMLFCACLLLWWLVLTIGLFVWVAEGTVPGKNGFGKLDTWENPANKMSG